MDTNSLEALDETRSGSRPPEGAGEIRAKVVLLGDAGVGKTSLVRRYASDEFGEDYVMTLGVVVTKRSVDLAADGLPARVTMLLWDTVGDHALASTLREAYLRDATGVLAVCDGSDPESIACLRPWLEAARRVAEPAALSVLVNKADLAQDPRAQVDALRAALELSAPCYRTSARTGENVRPALEALAHRIAGGALIARDARWTPSRWAWSSTPP